MPRAFPSAFSYPAESRDNPTLRSEPLPAEQPPREVQYEHALPGIGPVPRAGDEEPSGMHPCWTEAARVPSRASIQS